MAYFDKAQNAALQIKTILNETIHDYNPIQEELAYDGGVKQNTISQWLNPRDDRHMPAFQLLLQSEQITIPLCKEFVKRFGKKIVDEEFNLPTNGKVEDQLLNIDVIQADIIKRMDKDPKGALKFVELLLREVEIMKLELVKKIEK